MFSYRFKFHVNIITGSGVMVIYFYKGLTRNSEIGNTPVQVLPSICILGQIRDTKFGMDVSNKILLNAAKCQRYSFYQFRVWVQTLCLDCPLLITDCVEAVCGLRITG